MSTPLRLTAPPSKSLSHRALIAASLARGTSRLSGLLESDDTQRTIEILRQCGAEINRLAKGDYAISGMGGTIAPQQEINCFVGESGTTGRLLTAVLAAGNGTFYFHGNGRMHDRPMAELVENLCLCGPQLEFTEKEGFLPFRMRTKGLQAPSLPATADGLPISVSQSSQYLSGMVLAAPLSRGGLRLIFDGANAVSKSYILLTLQTLARHAVPFSVEIQNPESGHWIPVHQALEQHKNKETAPHSSASGYDRARQNVHEAANATPPAATDHTVKNLAGTDREEGKATSNPSNKATTNAPTDMPDMPGSKPHHRADDQATRTTMCAAGSQGSNQRNSQGNSQVSKQVNELTDKLETRPGINVATAPANPSSANDSATALFQCLASLKESRLWREKIRISIPAGSYQPARHHIEGDYSGASYLLAAGALGTHPVMVSGLAQNSLQGDAAILSILERMGATVTWSEYNGQPSVTVSPAPLQGIDVDMGDCPDLVPTVAILAARASSPTTIRNVGHLALKESNRLLAPAQELAKIGCTATVSPDSIIIYPLMDVINQTPSLSSHNDHRMAMSLALLELGNDMTIHLDNETCVDKSYPGFWQDWALLRPHSQLGKNHE